ncbi:hypothetical protein LTR66_006722 [Elasticomyces elasticus]|nr:hypothetical protein LTR66_006722 [Elasticomyces elasticus]
MASGAPLPHLHQATNFHLSEEMGDTSEVELAIERLMNVDRDPAPDAPHISPSPHESDRSSAAPVPHLSRLIRDAKGKFMFIGDSANLSLLQNIRRLIETSIGTCTFVVDPLRYLMVEDTPVGHPHWLDAQMQGTAFKHSLSLATLLVRQYMLATNCVLDLFDEAELLEQLPQWLDGTSDAAESLSSMYYLILAIGAQTSPEDKDELAESYFNYGRYLTARRYMEDPSILTIQAYALITMFMLGAARRNAAFMNLGIAVRAAYALGIHKRQVSDLFTVNERRTRERLWKVIRVLDLFMSASLGRPPSTSETRDTTSTENYSASASLCAIFENILTEVYSKRMVSTEVVESISEQHRNWAARLHEGLGVDGIKPTDDLLSGQQPNIGLYHIKEAYYWTIILLTRPFLIEYVSCHVATLASNPSGCSDGLFAAVSNQTLVDACVNSAVRTVELLCGLDAFDEIPKRLPFVVNSIFVSALVIGVAFFGDLDRTFPLKRSLRNAQKLLRRFCRYDAQAKRNLMIIEYLEESCNTYIERRGRHKMEGHSRVIGGIFGNIHRLEMEHIQQDSTAVMPNGKQQLRANHQVGHEPPLDPGNFQISGIDTMQPLDNGQSKGNEGHSSWHVAQTVGAGFSNDRNHPLPNGLEAYHDPAAVFSPQTLWFDSYEDNMPLFSTLHTGQFRHS